MFDLFHIHKLFKLRYIVNRFKGMMPIWIIFLMWLPQNFSLKSVKTNYFVNFFFKTIKK